MVTTTARDAKREKQLAKLASQYDEMLDQFWTLIEERDTGQDVDTIADDFRRESLARGLGEAIAHDMSGRIRLVGEARRRGLSRESIITTVATHPVTGERRVLSTVRESALRHEEASHAAA